MNFVRGMMEKDELELAELDGCKLRNMYNVPSTLWESYARKLSRGARPAGSGEACNGVGRSYHISP